jgi:hypothetical protein
MARVNLFFLTNVRYGGFVSYTEHLFRALQSHGHDPRIFKIGKTTEKRLRPFCGAIPYQNVNIDVATALAQRTASLIVCSNWKQHGEALETLLAFGAGIVFHDPTEFNADLLDLVRKNRSRVIVIRKSNNANLEEHDVHSVFIRHPYVPLNKTIPTSPRGGRSVSVSRVDWDKHTDTIIEANKCIHSTQAIDIYGPINRIYGFHKLDKIDSSWREAYRGTFPLKEHAAVRVIGKYTYVVDMSAIKQDGDGSQYTFLEAFDAGRPLIISARWFTGSGSSVLVDKRTAFVVDGVDALVKRISTGYTRTACQVRLAAYDLLKAHAPERIVPEYETLFRSQ